MTRKKKVVLWLVVVALLLAGAAALIVHGVRQMALDMTNPRVLTSPSPSGAGELCLMASGLRATDIEMYVIPAGQTEPVSGLSHPSLRWPRFFYSSVLWSSA